MDRIHRRRVRQQARKFVTRRFLARGVWQRHGLIAREGITHWRGESLRLLSHQTNAVSSRRASASAELFSPVLNYPCVCALPRSSVSQAKLAGAPSSPSAGIELHAKLGDRVQRGMPLFTLHAQAPGELAYAKRYLATHPFVTVADEVPQ